MKYIQDFPSSSHSIIVGLLLNAHHPTDFRNRLPHTVLPPLLLPQADIHSSSWEIQSHVFPDDKRLGFTLFKLSSTNTYLIIDVKT